MRSTRLLPYLFIVCLVVCLGVQTSRAQGDREGARGSLAGVSAFSVDATVEGPAHLAESDLLRVGVLIAAASERLREMDLPLAAASEELPNLHIHLNKMQVQTGLIAFSVELDFFQSVRLVDRRVSVDAITWNESVVGLVSHDRTSIIAESVLGLIDQFADDFLTVN
ncbi:MAG: hypothetical protein WD205_06090 [Rhodothermales bacterium]